MLKYFLILLLFWNAEELNSESLTSELIYLHPKPSSKFSLPETSIIMRFSDKININENVQVSVIGSLSGPHPGKLVFSNTNKTYIYKPHHRFLYGEKVTVNVLISPIHEKLSYDFRISSSPFMEEVEDIFNPDLSDDYSEHHEGIKGDEAVPSDYPTFRASINTEPADGKIFISSYDARYIMILNNDGSPYFYKKSASKVWGVSVQEELLTFMEGATARTMNQKFEVLNSYKCGGGYNTDHHEFRLLPNKNALLIATDLQQIDMSDIVSGGRTDALVKGYHIQEVDTEGNVLFQWLSWDNYKISDAQNLDLTAKSIDYIHMNAIDIDFDGHLVISSRHLNEITKINRITGDIIWRLGGKNNQYQFINDPANGFNRQHDIRAVEGKPGNYTLFDNGNYRDPQYSRAVEYKLDTLNMTAELVWEYRHSPDRYSNWMGSVQRLPNGNTLIGWSHRNLPKVTEISSEGTIVYEGDFVSSQTSYRAHRFDWEGEAEKPSVLIENEEHSYITLIINQFGKSDIEKFYIYSDITENPEILIDSTESNSINLNNLQNGEINYFRVTSVDSSGYMSEFSENVSTYVNITSIGESFIENGDFSNGFDNWSFKLASNADAQIAVNEFEECVVQIDEEGSFFDDIQVFQKPIHLIHGKKYKFEFEARSSSNKVIEVELIGDNLNESYSQFGLILVKPESKKFIFEFKMNSPTIDDASLYFNVGSLKPDIIIDNISLSESSKISDIAETERIGNSFKLHNNYPNPFNPTTTIGYSIPNLSDNNGKVGKLHIKLMVFDILGRKIGTLVDEDQFEGEYEVEFDALSYVGRNGKELTSGIYFYTFIAFNQIGENIISHRKSAYLKTKKMILLK